MFANINYYLLAYLVKYARMSRICATATESSRYIDPAGNFSISSRCSTPYGSSTLVSNTEQVPSKFPWLVLIIAIIGVAAVLTVVIVALKVLPAILLNEKPPD